MDSGCTLVRERRDLKEVIFGMQIAEESVVGDTKIAAIAGRNLKCSNCEDRFL